MLATLLGTASVGPVMLTMFIDVIVTITLCVGLSRLDSSALFTIGAMLARSKMNSTSRMLASYYLPVVMIKLFIHPLLLWSIGMHARFLGLTIDTFTLTTIVLLGALPSASNVSLLAKRFRADSGRIAQIILLTTTAAFFTFSVAVAIMT